MANKYDEICGNLDSLCMALGCVVHVIRDLGKESKQDKVIIAGMENALRQERENSTELASIVDTMKVEVERLAGDCEKQTTDAQELKDAKVKLGQCEAELIEAKAAIENKDRKIKELIETYEAEAEAVKHDKQS